MNIASPASRAVYNPYKVETSKTIPITVDGTDMGNITIRRDSFTGIVTIENYIPTVGNLSNVYFFEKEDEGRGENPFLFLIDVWLDAIADVSLGVMNVAAFEANAAANPNNFRLLQAVRDQANRKVLTEFKSKGPVELALFDATRRVRVTKCTSDFTCVPVFNIPVDVLA